MQSNKLIDEIVLFEERLIIALKAAKICIFEVDLEHQLYTFFENSEDIFGVPGNVILEDVYPYSKLSPDEYRIAVSNYFAHPDDADIIQKAFNDILSGRHVTYEARMRAGGSIYRWCKLDITPVLYHDKPVKIVGVITDISEMKRKQDILKNEANLDLFTGLYHKKAAITVIEETLLQQKDRSHALVVLDINKFKTYNDTYGHYEGDKALKTLADLMKENFRSCDILGRFGGDEFIILITNFPTTEWLLERVKPVASFESCNHSITTSVGIALYPQDATTFEDLFKKADKALYSSKASGKAVTFFSDLR